MSRKSVGYPYKNPVRYKGPNSNLVPIVKQKREPTTLDKNYHIGQFWLIDESPSTGAAGELWYLSEYAAGLPVWVKFDQAAAGMTSLRDQINTLVNPNASGEIDINGVTVANNGNPSGIPLETLASLNTLDVQVQVAATRIAAPLDKNDAGICSFDNTAFVVDANGYVSLVGGGVAPPLLTAAGDSGTAVPDGTGKLTFEGGTGITTVATANKVTTNLDSPVLVVNGGTERASHTEYAVICGGTTTTSAQQSIASVGTAAQVLTSNGAGALPTFQAVPAGSGWVFLDTATAAASATLDFVTNIDATYNLYAFVLSDILPASDNRPFQVLTSANAGVSYDTGATDYGYAYTFQTGATLTAAGSVGSAEVKIASTVGNATNEVCNGILYLYNPSSVNYTQFSYSTTYANLSGDHYTAFGSGTRKSAAAVDGVRFYFDSGNIASGTIKMYGCCKPA